MSSLHTSGAPPRLCRTHSRPAPRSSRSTEAWRRAHARAEVRPSARAVDGGRRRRGEPESREAVRGEGGGEPGRVLRPARRPRAIQGLQRAREPGSGGEMREEPWRASPGSTPTLRPPPPRRRARPRPRCCRNPYAHTAPLSAQMAEWHVHKYFSCTRYAARARRRTAPCPRSRRRRRRRCCRSPFDRSPPEPRQAPPAVAAGLACSSGGRGPAHPGL